MAKPLGTKAEVYIIESLGFDDEEHRKEGEIISKILRLSGNKPIYRYVRTKREFLHFIEDFEASRYRYLHISCHGKNDVIALTLEQYDNLSFSKAVGSKLDGRRLFISACGATTRNLAECLFQEAECRSLAGPKSNINFDDAAIFWTSFYHLMFKREAKSMSTRNIIGSSMVLGWALAEQFSLFYKSKDGNLIEQTLPSDASVKTRLESIIRGGL